MEKENIEGTIDIQENNDIIEYTEEIKEIKEQSIENKDLSNKPVYLTYASLSERIAASLIDSFIVGIPLIIILFIIFGLMFKLNETNYIENGEIIFIIALGVIFLLVTFVYHIVIPTFWRGYTVGRKLMGIRVVKSNGEDANFWRIFARDFIYNCGTQIFSYFYQIINIFSILYDKEHRAIHEMCTDTVVISEK